MRIENPAIPLDPGVEKTPTVDIGVKFHNACEILEPGTEGEEKRGFDGLGNPYQGKSPEEIAGDFHDSELSTISDRLKDLAENAAPEWFGEGTGFSEFKDVIEFRLNEIDSKEKDFTN